MKFKLFSCIADKEVINKPKNPFVSQEILKIKISELTSSYIL